MKFLVSHKEIHNYIRPEGIVSKSFESRDILSEE